MIRAPITDLDGVIRVWGSDHDLRAKRSCGLPPGTVHRIAFSSELLLPAITGRITDEAWRAEIKEQLRLRFPQADAARAVRLWSEPAGAVDPVALDLVRACRSRVKVVLLTNATSRLPRDLRRLGISDAFDHVVNSSDVGFVKPDSDIFRAALRTALVAAAEAVYVDDTPGHVHAAARLGITGHVYAGTEGLRAALQRHGVLDPPERTPLAARRGPPVARDEILPAAGADRRLLTPTGRSGRRPRAWRSR